ncbi:hypothetical protein E4U59_005378 [Claviceps monticola]|nr:hypothetical protein E4U59_005378 [Claviceps monticola]
MVGQQKSSVSANHQAHQARFDDPVVDICRYYGIIGFISTSQSSRALKLVLPYTSEVETYFTLLALLPLAAMADVQAKLQALSEDYQKLQQELQDSVNSRQKLQSQQQENAGVFREFEKLGEDETIYKLMGPVLLKQDKVEAESTVKGRLDFIKGEVGRSTRLETQIKETQDKMEKKKTEILQVQASAQTEASNGGKSQQSAN